MMVWIILAVVGWVVIAAAVLLFLKGGTDWDDS